MAPRASERISGVRLDQLVCSSEPITAEAGRFVARYLGVGDSTPSLAARQEG